MPADPPAEDKSEKSTMIPALILLAVFTGSLLYHFAISTISLVQHHRSQDWLTTPCTIASEHYKQFTSKPKTYQADIAFTYIFHGVTHHSSRAALWPGVIFASSIDMHNWLKNYPAGAKRSCLVDPAHPSQAILISTSSTAAIIVSTITGLILLVLVNPAILVIRSLRKTKQS